MKLKRNLFVKLTIKEKIILIIICITLMCRLFFNYINRNVIEPIEVYALNEIKKVGTLIISDASLDITNDEDEVLSFFDTVTNSNNEIVSVDFDTMKINKSLVKINRKIYDDIKKIESGNYEFLDESISMDEGVYKIPFGLITKNYILSNVSPVIPFKTKLIGGVVSNIRTEATSYGINNSLLKVYIDVSVNMRLMLPLISKDVKIDNSIPLVVKIINGKIPNVYGGSYAVTSPITSSN